MNVEFGVVCKLKVFVIVVCDGIGVGIFLSFLRDIGW